MKMITSQEKEIVLAKVNAEIHRFDEQLKSIGIEEAPPCWLFELLVSRYWPDDTAGLMEVIDEHRLRRLET